MNRSAPLRRTGPPKRNTPLSNGGGLARTGKPRRRARIATRPRRQPAHNRFPMTPPPGFWHEMMRRAGYTCQRCPSKLDLTLSHLVAAGRRGPFTAWNIRVLCWPCHDRCERHPEQAETEGWRVPGSFERRGNAWVYVGPDASYRWTVKRELAKL